MKREESGNLESPNLDLRNGEERETIKGRELEQVFILNGPIYIFFRLWASTYMHVKGTVQRDGSG